MRTAFDRRGRTMHELLSAIPGVTCLEPQGAFYCFPSFEGRARPPDRRPRTPRHSLELADVVLSRPRWPSCPARPSARPGYARFSFALGDDDLVEGITRLATLLS